MRRVTRGQERGFVFIITLMVLAGLMTLTMVGMTRTIAEIAAANRSVSMAKSFQMAEAGVDCAIQRLLISTNAPQIGAVCSAQAIPGETLAVAVSFQGGDVYAVTSTATHPGSVTQERLHATLQRFDPTQSPFRQAIYSVGVGTSSIPVDLSLGSIVDTYDSGSGPYGGANMGSHATVQTGSAGAWAMYIHDNALIRGDAYTAPGGSVRHLNTPPSGEDPEGDGVTGSYTGTRSPIGMVAVVRPAAPPNCDHVAPITVAPGETKEYDQEYLCTDSITVATGGRVSFPYLLHLAVAGNVSIVGGSMEVSEGIVNVSGTIAISNPGGVLQGTGSQVDVYTKGMALSNQAQVYGLDHVPANLRIYNVAPAHEAVTIYGQSNVYAAVYSPNALTELDGGSSVFGALIGLTVRAKHSSWLHFDEALQHAGSWPNWMGGGIQVVNMLAQYQE